MTLFDTSVLSAHLRGDERATALDPDLFAREVREAVASSLTAVNGRYELDVVGTIVWGRPAAPKSTSARAWSAQQVSD